MNRDPSEQLTLTVPRFADQYSPRRPLNKQPGAVEVTTISTEESSREPILQPESQLNWLVGGVVFPVLRLEPERESTVVIQMPSIVADPVRPRQFRHFGLSQLREAAYLKALGDDYDGEGSPGFASATVSRALEVSSRIGGYYSELFGGALAPARLRPGPSGSVDVVWENEAAELSIKVPPSPGVPSVYGESSSTNERISRRIFRADDEVAIARWLRGQCM